MNLRKAARGDCKAIRRLYDSAFPRNERIPFFLMKRRAMQNRAEVLVAEAAGKFIGFVYTGSYKDLVYLFYFAVAADKRGGGNGSEILRLLKAHYAGKKIFLCLEPLDDTADNRQERIHRRSFYLRNGFVDLPFKIREAALTFDVMSTAREVDPTDYNALVRNWAGGFVLCFVKMRYVA